MKDVKTATRLGYKRSRRESNLFLKAGSSSGSRVLTLLKRVVAGCTVWLMSILSIEAIAQSPRPEIEIQTGQSSVVMSVAYSPDGKLLASGGFDGTVTIWRMPDGHVINRLAGDNRLQQVSDLAFSPDGRYLACLSGMDGSEGTLRVWRVSNWKLLEPIRGLEGADFIAFSPDGKILSVGMGDRAWNISDSALKEASAPRRLLSFRSDEKTLSPDGSLEATDHDKNGPDWQIEIRRTRGNELVHRLPAKGRVPMSSKFCLPLTGQDKSFSPDGRFLAVGGWGDRGIKVWRVSDARLVKTLEGTGQALTLSFSPDGKFLITGHSAGGILLWNLSEGCFVRPYTVITSADRNVSRRDNQNYQDRKQQALQLLFSRDGRHLISRSSFGTVAVQSFPERRLISTSTSLYPIALSSDGQYIASKLSYMSDQHSVAFCRERFCDRYSFDRTCCKPRNNEDIEPRFYLRRVSDGRLLETGIRDAGIEDVTFHPNGKILAFGPTLENQTIRLMRISDGKVLRTMDDKDGCGGFDGSCGGFLKFSPDGRLLTSRTGSLMAPQWWYSRLNLWNAETGKLVKGFEDHEGPYHPVVFSPDGKTLVHGSHARLVFRRVSDGTILNKLDAHRPYFSYGGAQSINDLAFSPDGNLLASAGADGTVKIWKRHSTSAKENFDLVLTLVGLPDGEGITFTPDGYYNSSPEASSRVSWVFGGAMGREAFTFEQFESSFKRPDIVKARLKGDLKVGKSALPITRPPLIEMPDHLSVKQTSSVSYPLKLSASAPDQVKMLRIFVNGKPTSEVPIDAREKNLSLEVPLLPGMNRITAIAYNKDGFSSNPRYVDVLCSRTDLPRPDLYVFSIGISDYSKMPQLEFAHTDAMRFAAELKKSEGQIFGRVYQSVLTNKDVTTEKVADILDSLSAIRENDVAIIFMAGHGVQSAKDGAFYLLTRTGSSNEPEKGGLDWKHLAEHLSKIKGRVIVLLDACHSGSISTETIVPNDELARELSRGGRSGVIVFAASKGRQYAAETSESEGGIFAYALCQGLGPRSKEADIDGNGFVEFSELVEFVTRVVHTESDGEQTPWLARRELFGDFPIARVIGSQ
jgi:WD40 repeat protein